MNRRIVGVVVASAMMLLAGVAFAARGKRGQGMMGCNANVPIEQIREFQKETSTLRDEMMIKRVELQRERAKDAPDSQKVAQLTKELRELRDQIHARGEKYGMFADCPKNVDCWENGGCGMGCGAPAGGPQGGCRNCYKRR